MRSIVTCVLAVTMLIVMLGQVPAVAHERIESTRISLRASDTRIDPGRKVVFRGRLKSDWKKCYRWKRVILYRDTFSVAQKKTDRGGHYRFVRHPHITTTWTVKFAGKRWGVHPHRHRCLASESRSITVRVT